MLRGGYRGPGEPVAFWKPFCFWVRGIVSLRLPQIFGFLSAPAFTLCGSTNFANPSMVTPLRCQPLLLLETFILYLLFSRYVPDLVKFCPFSLRYSETLLTCQPFNSVCVCLSSRALQPPLNLSIN